jgi:hypothetical protein
VGQKIPDSAFQFTFPAGTDVHDSLSSTPPSSGKEPKPFSAHAPDSVPSASPSKEKGAKKRPVSMSAEEFGRLSTEEQRQLLTRVFERRLEHSKNLYYEMEQRFTTHENSDGQPGKLLERSTVNRLQYRHWRLGGSFRMDYDALENPNAREVSTHYSCGVNAEEGVGRNTTVCKDGKQPPSGQVQYPFDPTDNNIYVHWLDGNHSIDLLNGSPHREDYLFRDILMHKDAFEIETPVEGGMVQLTIPYQPGWAEKPGGKRVFLLDPQKGFLPVRGDSRWREAPRNGDQVQWRVERFVVEDSRLVGDVWMPFKLTEQTLASPVPEMIAVVAIKVSRMECGTVKRADLAVRFTEGMKVVDVIEGVSYVADAQGNPAGPVKFEPNWKQQPPETWPKRSPTNDKPKVRWTLKRGAGGYSMASNLSDADRKRLDAETKAREMKKEGYNKSTEATLRVFKSASQDERMETALKILRTHSLARDEERLWALAIRELIQIGKPAVPKLIEELDRAKTDQRLRAIGFVLRGIGDPRSVPALIRAIPRTLELSDGGDCGLEIPDDLELSQFMREHDNEYRGKPGASGNRSPSFSYGRPINEIMPAMERMTGEDFGWREFRFACLRSGSDQRRMQQRLFLNHAEQWAAWWAKSWRKYVVDESEAQLDLNRQAMERYAKSIPPAANPPRSEFPCGPKVCVGNGSTDSMIKSFDEWPESGFADLDTGRLVNPPQTLVAGSPNHEPSQELLAWAKRQGVDLIHVKIKPKGSDKWHYAFLPVDMKVWRIENSRFNNIENELRTSKKLELPPPWNGPLAAIDEKTGMNDDKQTASFLFITREGTCGAIQLKSPISGGGAFSAGGLSCSFIYESDDTDTTPTAQSPR